jgi:hypothetical protein
VRRSWSRKIKRRKSTRREKEEGRRAIRREERVKYNGGEIERGGIFLMS